MNLLQHPGDPRYNANRVPRLHPPWEHLIQSYVLDIGGRDGHLRRRGRLKGVFFLTAGQKNQYA